jgi:hypothetical protein
VDHYDVLGVSPTATDAEIRRAYLRLAREHHPDLQAARGRVSDDRMRMVNQAWSVLGDAERRRSYDDDRREERRAGRRQGMPDPEFVPYDDEDVDYASLLDDTPVRGTQVPRWVQLLPVVLLGVGLFATSAGLAASFSPLLALGVICVVLSGLAFLGAPTLAVMRSYQAEKD